MQTTLYEGRIGKVTDSQIRLDGLDVSCDFIEVTTVSTMGINHEIQNNNYITLAVIKDKFKVGDFVSLRLVKEENLT